ERNTRRVTMHPSRALETVDERKPCPRVAFEQFRNGFGIAHLAFELRCPFVFVGGRDFERDFVSAQDDARIQKFEKPFEIAFAAGREKSGDDLSLPRAVFFGRDAHTAYT